MVIPIPTHERHKAHYIGTTTAGGILTLLLPYIARFYLYNCYMCEEGLSSYHRFRLYCSFKL